MFGGTITALMAGAIINIMVSAMLHVANNHNDYVWLFDIFDKCKAVMQRLKDYLAEINDNYTKETIVGELK